MNINPLSGHSMFLRVLLGINIPLLLIALAGGAFEYHTYTNLPPDVDPNEELFTSDIVTMFIGLAQLVLGITLGITFLSWIYRINKNLNALSWDDMRFTPGWSIGWYFIPIANLFKPYQVMKEIWEVAHRGESSGQPLLGWWWGLWIISNIAGNAAMRLALNDSPEIIESMLPTIMYLISDGLDIPLSIVSLLMVTRIAGAYQRHLAETQGLGDVPQSEQWA